MNKPPVDLKVTHRGDDYHCQLADNPKVWECGKTLHDAIGHWIITHGSDYAVTVNKPKDR